THTSAHTHTHRDAHTVHWWSLVSSYTHTQSTLMELSLQLHTHTHTVMELSLQLHTHTHTHTHTHKHTLTQSTLSPLTIYKPTHRSHTHKRRGLKRYSTPLQAITIF